MGRLALPCIACGRELRNVDDSAGNQPYNGTSFVTHGHYGSTIYDPMDGHFIEVNVCDACLALHPERVVEGRDRRPVMEDQEVDFGEQGVRIVPTVVGWEDVKWRTVPWSPRKKEIDYALEVAIRESGIYPVDESEGEAVPDA